ncbi:hypothetical protein JKP88DRAFT_196210 [Tribonema minus]|uniref:Exocyst complex component Sec8 n=1 Tax=Tribonema minus TaxID=303371 RepID=A0A835YXP6_9STRA|nr:hypothetical protein JKP88DRAFT_196210 [Tribonema minus]
MGAVTEHYNKTRSNVGTLREQIRECKGLLQNGSQQADVRELWQRKAQYAQVLRLLDMLDMVKSTPVKFDRLVRQRRFVAAVNLLNASLEAIFTPELVDVPAVASVRDELLARKGIILETIVRELADTLFLRTATDFSPPDAEPTAAGGASGSGRGRAGGSSALSRKGGGGRALGEDTAAGAGNGASGVGGSMTFAGLTVHACSVSEEAERALEDPAREFATYTALLVEAVRRLRALPDVERHLLERLECEVERLSTGHMLTVASGAEGMDAATPAAAAAAAGPSSPPSASSAAAAEAADAAHDTARLTRYLRSVFEAFVRVIHNHVYLVGQLLVARRRDAAEAPGGAAAAHEADLRCRDDLPAAAWRHMQAHVIAVLSRHLAMAHAAHLAAAAGKSLVSLALMRGGSGKPDAAAPAVIAAAAQRAQLAGGKAAGGGGGAALAAAAFNGDRDKAAEFARTCLLVQPSPFVLIGVFRHAVKFATLAGALLGALKKEIQERYSAASFVPVAKAAGGAGADPAAELRKVGRASFAKPGRGAEAVAGQAALIFRAMVQVPAFVQDIGSALDITLENYYQVARDKFQEFCGAGAAYKRLVRSGDKLRDLLRRDAQFLLYKRSQHGGKLPFADDLSGANSKTTPPRTAGGATLRRAKTRGGLDLPSTSAPTPEDDAEDLFESELKILEDHWRVGGGAAVARDALLEPRRLQAVACLAFSCDWLVHKVVKMCTALDKQASAAATAAAAPAAFSPTSPVAGSTSTSGSTGPSPATRLRAVARKLSGLADDCALILRLELYMHASHYLAALAAADLGGGADAADACVIDLCRVLRDTQEALSPMTPKPGMGLAAPRELFAYAVAPLPRMLPRLLVHALGGAAARPVSAVGVGKAAKIVAALQQLASDVTETSLRQLVEGAALAQVVTERFSRAARYASLMGATHAELEGYIRANRSDFTKEELRAQWNLQGPARRADECPHPFEAWWASERF